MKVAIFGAGYVGLVTGVCLSAIGHDVTVIDVSAERVSAINAGKSPIYEIGLDALLTETLGSGRFRATLDAKAALEAAELSMIAVGTPQDDGKIDLSYVHAVTKTIGEHLKTRATRHTVVVKSTVVPGTTGGFVRQMLEKESGKVAGKDFGLCMNPEFLREGTAVADFMEPDRVVVGQLDAASGDTLEKLYDRFSCPKLRVDLVNAELIKYASNTLLATLISFSNELYGLCEVLPGADGEQVMDGLALDKRLSPVVDGKRVSPGILTYLRGGIGYGGSCLPKDLTALRAHAEALKVPTPVLRSVMDVNAARPKAITQVLDREMSGVSGKTVAVLGLAFKPDTDDLRDSPAIPLVDALLAAGARVRAYDPQAADNARGRWGDTIALAKGPEELLGGADCALLATSWSEFAAWDWQKLAKTMSRALVVDGRNALRKVKWPEGVRYVTVGRGPAL